MFLLPVSTLWLLGGTAYACELSQRDELPANAALVFDSDCEDAAIVASVDGEPAALVWNPYAALTDYPGFAVIEPAVEPGQQVLVQIDNAAYLLEVVPDDDEAPAQTDIELIFEDVECPEAPSFDCEPGEPLTEVGVRGMLERGVVRSITLSADGVPVEENRVFVIGSDPTIGFGRSLSRDTREVCVDVVDLDAAGNAGELQTCEAKQVLVDRGCGCTSHRQGPAWAWFLVPLLGWRR